MAKKFYVNLFKNTIVLGLGTFSSKAIAILMLPIYTRALTTHEYGQLDIILTTITLILPILSLNIFDAVFRFTLKDNQQINKKKILTTSLIILLGAILCLILAYPVFYHVSVMRKYYFLFFVILIAQITYYIFKIFIRAEKQLKLYAFSDFFYTLIFATAGIVLVVVLEYGIYGYLLANLIALGLTTLLILVAGKGYQHISPGAIDLRFLKTMLIYSIPLIPNAISWWIVNSSDRYIVAYFLGYEETGIYSVAYKFPTMLMILYTIFALAWQISSIEEYTNPKKVKLYSNTFKYVYVLLFLGVILFSFIMRPLIYLMTSPEFRDAWLYVPFILMGVVFYAFSSFFGVGYLASKKTIGAFLTTLVGAGVNIGLNIALIPLIGLQGAAIGTMFGMMVIWIFRYFETRSYFPIDIDWRKFIILYTLSYIAIGLTFFKLYGLPFQILCLIIVIIISKSDILQGTNFILKSLKARIANQ